MIEFYPQIKSVHIAAVMLSGLLFLIRGAAVNAGMTWAMAAPLRYLSYLIDTTLLTAALMLATVLHQYPFVHAWLTVKVVLLAIYIVLGTFALKRGSTRKIRVLCWLAALLVYGFIITVARAHHPAGLFAAIPDLLRTSTLDPGQENRHRPVVHVSWFAATAYCEAQGARLPRWHEWEYVAAASDRQRDARNDPAWRQQILNWYSRSGRGPLPDVGGTAANAYGIQDLHGVIWEWVEDAGGMLVSSDNREQSSADVMRFCGEGALTLEQKENYATLMRIAMLSSMKARYTSATMGFRCASEVRTGS